MVSDPPVALTSPIGGLARRCRSRPSHKETGPSKCLVSVTDTFAAELEALYRQRHTAFCRTLAAILGDGESAADAVQEGFARALIRADQFRGEGSLDGWVWAICLNAGRNGRRGPVELPLTAAHGAPAAPLASDPELAAAMRALPQRRRLVAFLYYYADLSYDEIAQATGMRPGTVAAHLSQARESLSHHLRDAETV